KRLFSFVKGLLNIVDRNGKYMVNFLKNSRKINGQSVVEYSLVIILVTASLITMGPYVRRAWNAHVKGLEDSVSDSQNDPLIQANVASDITINRCVCEYMNPPGCIEPDPGQTPDPCCSVNGCPAYNRTWIWSCVPANCDTSQPAVLCEFAAGCCDPWANASPLICGADATNAPIPPSADGTCDDGLSLQSHLCGVDGGGTLLSYQCSPDSGCVFACLALTPPLPLFSNLCDGDDERLKLLDNNSHNLVDLGGCTLGTKCEYECMSSFYSAGSTIDCRCAPGRFPMDTCGTLDPFFPQPTVNSRVISYCNAAAADQFCIANGHDYAQTFFVANSDSGSLPGYPWGSAPCNILWNGAAWVNGNCTSPVYDVCYNITCGTTCTR
ncbi:MAG: hypothetical protein KJ736_07345, partial [Candidatus Omnitrophica bacterium]|nr:hypothetical protein [Candidatus Omnitrophota bacterium]